MSGSVVAPTASRDAGPSRWQRARLVLDQHQRERDATTATRPGQVLPVRAELADLFPHRGLRRGGTVAVRGSTSLLLALLAEATTGGSWAAIVGMPDLGVVAAAELGVAIQRLALIPHPGTTTPEVVAALLDGMDLVVVAQHPRAPTITTTVLARRLSARARHRQSVLLATGEWPAADLELSCGNRTWSGVGTGNGRLRAQTLTVLVRGRGIASRPTTHRLTFPATHIPTAPRETTNLIPLPPRTAIADESTPDRQAVEMG